MIAGRKVNTRRGDGFAVGQAKEAEGYMYNSIMLYSKDDAKEVIKQAKLAEGFLPSKAKPLKAKATKKVVTKLTAKQKKLVDDYIEEIS